MAAPWHIRKVLVLFGFELLQLEFELFNVQVPTTTPLLRVPMVEVVPFDTPVSAPLGDVVKVSTLPGIVVEVMVKVKLPVTCPALFVFRVAVPVSVCAVNPVSKHAPELKKPKPVIWSGWLETVVFVVFVMLNEVTKFRSLTGALLLNSWASQFPLVFVVTTVLMGGFPHPQTASSTASTSRSASFFMSLPWWDMDQNDLYENREMRAGPSMDVRMTDEIGGAPARAGAGPPSATD